MKVVSSLKSLLQCCQWQAVDSWNWTTFPAGEPAEVVRATRDDLKHLKR